MSFADIALIFDLLHAAALCSPLLATEYDAGGGYTRAQVLGGFGMLHLHGLTDSQVVTDSSGYRTLDYQVHGLTPMGRRIYQVLLQTQLAFGHPEEMTDR